MYSGWAAISLAISQLSIEYGIREVDWRQVVRVKKHLAIRGRPCMDLSGHLRPTLQSSACRRARSHGPATSCSIGLNHSYHAVLDAGLDPILYYLFYPGITPLSCFGREDEPALGIVPVLFTILPLGCIMALVVVGPKFFADDLFAKELMLDEGASSFISDCHSMACDDLGFPLGLWFVEPWHQALSLPALCALWPLSDVVVRHAFEVQEACLGIVTRSHVSFRRVQLSIQSELLVRLQ